MIRKPAGASVLRGKVINESAPPFILIFAKEEARKLDTNKRSSCKESNRRNDTSAGDSGGLTCP